MLRQPRKKCMVHLEGLNNSLRQRQVWRLISKISSERERADRNQMTVLATRAFGRGAAGPMQLDGTVPGLACLCRCAAGKSVADGGGPQSALQHRRLRRFAAIPP